MLATALVALAAVSCSKEGTPSAGQKDGISTITLSIEQPTAENVTKTALGDKSGDYYPVNWSADDAVAVSGQSESSFVKYSLSEGSGSATGTFSTTETAPSGAVYAYYPYANVTGVSAGTYSVTIPDIQEYAAASFGNGAMPMYAAASDASDLGSMAPLMSVLKISLTGSCNVKSILLKSASVNLSGAATVNMASGEVSFTSGKKYVLLTCEDGVKLSSTATTFHIVVPATAAEVTDFTVTIKDDKGYLMQKNLSTTNKFSAKVIKNIGTELPVATSCLLPGKFSVSENKQVRFTSANLWCNAEANPVTFHFETSQTAYPATWSASHVGYFFWTSADDYELSDNAAYKPYASSYAYSSRSTTDEFWCGKENTLTVDGQEGLYALTGEDYTGEWYYLFSERSNSSNLYKGDVSITIGETTASNCVIIAPDGYTGTLESSYDTAAWAAAEASGLVCLPAAGFSWLNNSNLEIRAAGDEGSYWSASPYGDVDTAWCLNFDGEISTMSTPFGDIVRGPNINPTASSNRKYGNSIRLVFSVSK